MTLPVTPPPTAAPEIETIRRAASLMRERADAATWQDDHDAGVRLVIVLLSGTRHAGEVHWPTIEARLLQVVGDPLGGHTLREGEAKGVDRAGARLAESWGWTVERFPAVWDRCAPDVPEELGGCPPRPHLRMRRNGPYCPNAGPLRNQRMVDRQPRADVAVCFPAVGCRGRSGTWDLAARAADAGIPVHLFPLAVDIPTATPLPYPQPEEA